MRERRRAAKGRAGLSNLVSNAILGGQEFPAIDANNSENVDVNLTSPGLY